MNSGERRVISSVALQAQDLDTPSNQVFFLLNAEPRFGKLLLKVRINAIAVKSSEIARHDLRELLFLQTRSGWTELTAGRNFTQDDVDANRLWYEHAAHAAGFKGHDSFRFSLSDLDNETPAQSFFISVHTVQKGQRSH